VVVISFLPEFVCSLGSPPHDCAFLLPFYSKVERRPHVVRAGDDASPDVHGALARLLDPGETVGGDKNTGWLQILTGITAHRREDGEYLVFVEGDCKAKVLLYRWKP